MNYIQILRLIGLLIAAVGVILFVPVSFCSGSGPGCTCYITGCASTNGNLLQAVIGFALAVVGILIFVWSKSTRLLRIKMKFGYKGTEANMTEALLVITLALCVDAGGRRGL